MSTETDPSQPSQSAKQETPSEPTKQAEEATVPETGASAGHWATLGALMFAGGLVALLLLKKRQKREQDNES